MVDDGRGRVKAINKFPHDLDNPTSTTVTLGNIFISAYFTSFNPSR